MSLGRVVGVRFKLAFQEQALVGREAREKGRKNTRFKQQQLRFDPIDVR